MGKVYEKERRMKFLVDMIKDSGFLIEPEDYSLVTHRLEEKLIDSDFGGTFNEEEIQYVLNEYPEVLRPIEQAKDFIHFDE